MWLTDADLTYFWLGPLGYLRQLPLLPVAGSVQAPEELVGGLHQAVDGTGTQHVLGHKRSWQLDWVCLTPAEIAAVHAWYQGLVRADLRLVDPRAGNLLTRDGASGGSYNRDTGAHTVTAGDVGFAAVTDYPADLLGVVDGGVEWDVPVTTAATMLIDDTDRIPLIPGQQITMSVLVEGTGGVQVGAQTYDTTGAAAGTSLASSVTLGSWGWVSHTFTPTSGQVSAALAIAAASGAARTITVGPALWHPTNTDWCPGHGCPRVLPTAMPTSYPGLAHLDPGLTLQEA